MAEVDRSACTCSDREFFNLARSPEQGSDNVAVYLAWAVMP